MLYNTREARRNCCSYLERLGEMCCRYYLERLGEMCCLSRERLVYYNTFLLASLDSNLQHRRNFS